MSGFSISTTSLVIILVILTWDWRALVLASQMGLGGVESGVWRLPGDSVGLGCGGPRRHVVGRRPVGGRQVGGGLQGVHPAPQATSTTPCPAQAGSVSGGLGHVIHGHWSLEAAVCNQLSLGGTTCGLSKQCVHCLTS